MHYLKNMFLKGKLFFFFSFSPPFFSSNYDHGNSHYLRCGRNYNDMYIAHPKKLSRKADLIIEYIECVRHKTWWSVLSNHYKSRKILTSKAECYCPTSVWAALFQGLHASSCNDKNTIFQWNNRPCLPWSRAILCFQSDLVQEAFSGIEAHTILEPSNMEINF